MVITMSYTGVFATPRSASKNALRVRKVRFWNTGRARDSFFGSVVFGVIRNRFQKKTSPDPKTVPKTDPIFLGWESHHKKSDPFLERESVLHLGLLFSLTGFRAATFPGCR